MTNVKGIRRGWTALVASALLCTTAAAEPIRLTVAQIDALGIRIARPMPAKHVELGPFPSTVTVSAMGQHTLQADVIARIERLHVRAGEHVTKGEPVLTLGGVGAIALQQTLLADYDALALAKLALQADTQLNKRGAKSDRQLEQTRAQLTSAQAAFLAATSELQYLGVSQSSIDAILDTHTVSATLELTAPRDGVVADLNLTVGGSTSPGQPLLTLVDPTALIAQIHIPKTRCDAVNEATAALLALPTADGEPIPATLLSVDCSSSGRQLAGSVYAKFDATTNFQRGQLIHATLLQPIAQHHAYLLPASALTRINNRDHIFIANNGLFSPVAVIATEQASGWLVEIDREETDQVVVDGTLALKAAWQSNEFSQ